MCQNCNGNCNGLGATRQPLVKVATTTAPIYTPPIAPQITTSGMAQNVYSPPVNNTNNFWGGLTDLATGVFDFINTNNLNKQMTSQQAQYQNQLAYGMQQQPVQYAQVLPQQSSIDMGKITKGVLLAGVIIGGIYLIKK